MDEVANGGEGVNFKGAASAPYTVVAQNFAPGTTAADIESVMLSVGGQMTSCRLVASNPTVIAEMSFVERGGAEKVIDTFNGKKVSSTLFISMEVAYISLRLMAVHSTFTGSPAVLQQDQMPKTGVRQLKQRRQPSLLVQTTARTW